MVFFRTLSIVLIAVGAQLPLLADEGGQVITTGSGIFMEEVEAESPPYQHPGRNQGHIPHGQNSIPIDLTNVGVPVDAQGKIIPLIEGQGSGVIPFGSSLEAYNEIVNPYGPYWPPHWQNIYSRNPYWNNPYRPVRYFPNQWGSYPYNPYYSSPLQRILPEKVWNKVRPYYRWLPRTPYYAPGGPVTFNSPGMYPPAAGSFFDPLYSRQSVPQPNIGMGFFAGGSRSFGGGILSPFGL